MRESRFSFYNINTSKLIIYLATTLVISVFVALITGIYWWIILFPILIASLIILEVNKSYVTITEHEKSKTVSVKTFKKKDILTGPIVWDSFWTYDFNGKPHLFRIVRGKKNRSNDILVYLHIEDKVGKELIFLERNVFGASFPNHVRYRKNGFETDLPILKIQRVEKLLSFFTTSLSKEEFCSVVKMPDNFT